MKSRLSPSGLACVIAVATAATARCQDGAPQSHVGSDCGVRALYSLLRLEGRKTGFEEVESLLPPRSSDGHSMKELRDASRACGLRLTGVLLAKDANAIDRPMIVFVKRQSHGHFIVARPVGHSGNFVQVVDSARAPEVLDKSELMSTPGWTGLALVPNDDAWSEFVPRGGGLALCILIAAGLFTRHRRHQVTRGSQP